MRRYLFPVIAKFTFRNSSRFLFYALLITNCLSSCGKKTPTGDPDNGGLVLPGGFEALVVVDSLQGAARHLDVNTNGDIYVKLRFPDSLGGNTALRDIDHDGKADSVIHFDDYEDKSSYGTEMRVHDGYLYFSSVTRVFRQKLTGDLIPDSPIELLLTDTQPPRQHDTKPIAFDDQGNMYIPFGAPSDCCQIEDRRPNSPGMNPCPILEHRASIWKFSASKNNQLQGDGKKFTSGVRSIVALAWNPVDKSVYTLMHGRDYLHSTWPDIFDQWQGAVLPSEEFLKLHEGADVGWPYYYYDHLQEKLFLNPEYGGDGKKEGNGKDYLQPVIGFPGHFAPNDLLFYTGDQFPEHYKNGAFAAFHGSTSSAPYPQTGYFIAFIPYVNGELSKEWEVFADGFAGIDTVLNTSDAKYRPMGLATGPDGSLYVSDSEKGKIWRIMYKGDKKSFGQKELAGMKNRKQTALNIKTPDRIKDNLEKENTARNAQLYIQNCGACHQANGMGNDRFPPLHGSEWVTGDTKRLIGIVLNGLEGEIKVKGKNYNNNMPKLDMLGSKEIAQILSYVRKEFGNNASPITPEEVGTMKFALRRARQQEEK